MSLLIVGCGYVGRPVAVRWMESGQPVAAITRGGASLGTLASCGIQPVVVDWLDEHASWQLPFQPRQVLVAVPHREDHGHAAQTHVVGLQNLLKRCPQIERLVVLSTTGVYHQHDGGWVDEQSPTEPTRIGPQIALAAERWLAEHCAAGRATSLRLAGIYGPDRVPLLAKLRAVEPIPVGSGFLNLIHLDDIVSAVVGLLSAKTAGRCTCCPMADRSSASNFISTLPASSKLRHHSSWKPRRNRLGACAANPINELTRPKFCGNCP